ncbi:protein kinase-like [Striga asiatica]|uniref:Protein kinase-like n=1 Tax=Striga asiatica TaxID=4170 RepID=A0A5A7RHC1_STRAF|nr:protein kinase-like [Striga asiatica]
MATGFGPWRRRYTRSHLPETPGGLSDEAEEMLTRCLTKDPRERWTAAQLLQHPFVDSVEEEEEEEIVCLEIRELTRKYLVDGSRDLGFSGGLQFSELRLKSNRIRIIPDGPGSGFGRRDDQVSVLSFEASHWKGIDAPNLLLQPSSDSVLPLLSMTATAF